jgi:hypothetical protein
MSIVRSTFVPPVVVAAALTFASFASLLCPSVAHADERARVESIAAKGNISPMVPVEGGLALGLAAGLLALGLQLRSRR